MGGSTADTPTTPESLRASDADRDHAVNELRDEFAEGRLSHETFVYRMQTALDARNHGQLAKLFTDLPPRRSRAAELMARLRAALRGDGRGSPDQRAYSDQPAGEARRPERVPGPGPWASGSRPASGSAPFHGGNGVNGRSGLSGSGAFHGSGGPGAAPAALCFPPGRGGRFTIGRTRDCDLCLTDLSVSRLHAELVRNGDGWLLNDLGSHNGTRLNGWLVRETVPVREGDLVEFGSVTFILRDDPQGPALSGAGDRTG
ncbi:MAG TPA: DUF1707 and FHA domain-containing protein [Streptosporangiaceae bacterium]|nr:DUF1707 and FHA domain-containing protein [Streptosporangiaceae bacterium]